MNNPKIRTYRRFALFLAVAMMGFWACHLGETTKVEETVTFPKLYDSLKQYDRAVIVFTTENGTVLDTVFDGKLTSATQLENLKVDGWDGGKVLIVITGYMGDVAVYGIKKDFDGKSDTSEETFVIIDPGSSLSYPMSEITLLEGDSIPLPDIIIKPANLAGKSLLWSSSHSDIVLVGANFIKAMKRGSSEITVSLQSDPAKKLILKITVQADAKVPESMTLSAETLFVASKGAQRSLTVQVQPLTASKEVTWRMEDSTIATVGLTGLVQGHKNGFTKLWAVSKENASISASAVVEVSDPVAVASVRFLKDSTDVFIRGAAESLYVEVLPAKANPNVDFSVSDISILSVANGRISGLIEGYAYVYAASRENADIKDSMRVHVLPSQIVDSVVLTPATFKLFTGGESQTLSAKVMPNSVSPKVQWLSAKPGIASVDAAGKVSPVSAGITMIYAISLADSLKRDSSEVNVKVDAPVLTVGQDTVISLGQTLSFLPVVAKQEYGLIEEFKWDLDGNLVWDDSSDAVKAVSYRFDQEKDYSVRFYVRDSEGNEVVVFKSVRSVKGPVINIISPANNSYSRVANIAVKWTVDQVEQDSLNSAILRNGANTITRTVRDSAGTSFSTSITVTLDSVPPPKPLVHGPAAISNTKPSWTWSTGGVGGNGVYRIALDVESFDGAVETKDTVYSPETPLTETLHTLFVQERDLAGNWSLSGSLAIRVDVTPPAVPSVKVNPTGSTNSPKPVWTWTSTGGGNGGFQFKLGTSDFSTGAVSTTALEYTPDTNLLAGVHTLWVRERDSTGNWSLPGNAAVTLDFEKPNAPKVVGSSPTSANPKWSWSSGGNGGSGDFRYKLGAEPTGADAATRTLEYVLTAPAPVSGQTYTLYVQEKDAAGNWSLSGSLPIKFDLTKPTVTIESPLASGTYITNVDSATAIVVSGKATANLPNTITKVTYSLDGGAETATTGTAGTWSASIKLPTEKTYSIKVTATDNLNNTGEANLLILKDRTGPPAPKIVTAPASIITTTTGKWTWSQVAETVPPGSGVNGNFRYTVNGGTLWTETTDLTVTLTTLKEGAQTFLLQQQDNARNWSASTPPSVVTVDTKAPDAVTFIGADKQFTKNRKPTWSWNPSTTNFGINTYQLTIDAGPDAGAFWDVANAKTWTSDKTLPDGAYKLTVRQQDQVPTVLGDPGTFTWYVDGTSPVISVTSHPNGSTAATMTGSNSVTLTGAITDNAGGSGIASATWELSGGTTKAAANITNLGAFSISTGAMKNHATTTLTIRAKDAVGNAEQTYTVSFPVDVKAPTIEISSGPEDGYVTSADRVTYVYAINGVTQPTETIFLTAPGSPDAYTTKTKTFTATNAINETISETRNIYRAHADVRFFAPQGSGTGDCLSWKNACTFHPAWVGSAMAGKHLWLTAGEYSVPSTGDAWTLPAGAALHGQLHKKSRSPSERSGVTRITVSGKSLEVKYNRLSFINFTGVGDEGVLVINVIDEAENQPIMIDNCVFEDIPSTAGYVGTAINARRNQMLMTITDTKFTDVASGSGGAAVYVYGAGSRIGFTRTTFNGVQASQDVWVGGEVEFKDCNPNQPSSWPSTQCVGTTCQSSGW